MVFWIYVWCDFRSHGIQSLYVEVNKLDGKDKGKGEELEKRVSTSLLGNLYGLIFRWLHLKFLHCHFSSPWRVPVRGLSGIQDD